MHNTNALYPVSRQPKKRQHYISRLDGAGNDRKSLRRPQSRVTTVGPRFFFWSAVLRRVVFCQSRLLRAVSLCLKCSTFKRSPYESDSQEQHGSSPSHTPPNIYKSEDLESRLPNCSHSDHVPIPRTMDNA